MSNRTILISPLPSQIDPTQIQALFQGFGLDRIHIQDHSAYVQFQHQSDLQNLDFLYPAGDLGMLEGAKFKKVDQNFDWRLLENLSVQEGRNEKLATSKEKPEEPEEFAIDLTLPPPGSLVTFKGCDLQLLNSMTAEQIQQKVFSQLKSVNRVLKNKDKLIIQLFDPAQIDKIHLTLDLSIRDKLGPKTYLEETRNEEYENFGEKWIKQSNGEELHEDNAVAQHFNQQLQISEIPASSYSLVSQKLKKQNLYQNQALENSMTAPKEEQEKDDFFKQETDKISQIKQQQVQFSDKINEETAECKQFCIKQIPKESEDNPEAPNQPQNQDLLLNSAQSIFQEKQEEIKVSSQDLISQVVIEKNTDFWQNLDKKVEPSLSEDSGVTKKENKIYNVFQPIKEKVNQVRNLEKKCQREISEQFVNRVSSELSGGSSILTSNTSEIAERKKMTGYVYWILALVALAIILWV